MNTIADIRTAVLSRPWWAINTPENYTRLLLMLLDIIEEAQERKNTIPGAELPENIRRACEDLDIF
jgi:hypothetical protein